jgi:hypothetical protein
MLSGPSRRDFLLASVGLVEWALVRGAIARPARREARQLLADAFALGRAYAAGRLTPAAWQDGMAQLFAGLDVTDLVRFIRMDEIVRTAAPVSRGARVIDLPVRPELAPMPVRAGYKLFLFGPGRANPPHAHDHMVSMHLVLRGRFRVRHFERIRDEPGHMVLRPSMDRELGPGQETTISDARDNVHWHVTQGGGVLLDVLQSSPATRTQLLDLDTAEPLEGGLLRALRIGSVEEALAKYG